MPLSRIFADFNFCQQKKSALSAVASWALLHFSSLIHFYTLHLASLSPRIFLDSAEYKEQDRTRKNKTPFDAMVDAMDTDTYDDRGRTSSHFLVRYARFSLISLQGLLRNKNSRRKNKLRRRLSMKVSNWLGN